MQQGARARFLVQQGARARSQCSRELTSGAAGRAGVDSPTSPTLAGPYFRGALIRWVCQSPTDMDFSSITYFIGKERKILVGKKTCATTGN